MAAGETQGTLPVVEGARLEKLLTKVRGFILKISDLMLKSHGFCAENDGFCTNNICCAKLLGDYNKDKISQDQFTTGVRDGFLEFMLDVFGQYRWNLMPKITEFCSRFTDFRAKMDGFRAKIAEFRRNHISTSGSMDGQSEYELNVDTFTSETSAEDQSMQEFMKGVQGSQVRRRNRHNYQMISSE